MTNSAKHLNEVVVIKLPTEKAFSLTVGVTLPHETEGQSISAEAACDFSEAVAKRQVHLAEIADLLAEGKIANVASIIGYESDRLLEVLKDFDKVALY